MVKYAVKDFVFLIFVATALTLSGGCSDEIVNPDNDDCQCPIIETGIIVINPGPDELNAPWTLALADSLTFSSTGDSTLVEMPPGAYTLTWGIVPERMTPPSETLTLAAGATLMFSGVYLEPQVETIVRVNPEGTGDYATIQAAVDGALPMSTIILANGVYTGEGNRNILIQDKILSIISEDAPGYATLECDYEARGFTVTGVPFLWLEGIQVLHGFPVSSSGYGSGGGVYAEESYVIVTNCHFTSGRASWGGGLCCKNNGKFRVQDCGFSSNTAATGGAVAASFDGDIELSNCTFYYNTANRGGAIFSKGQDLTVSGSDFRFNEALHVDSGGGGAICVENADRLSVSGCVFAINSAVNSGGGIFAESTSVSVTDCTFWLNQGAVGDAGGISLMLCESVYMAKTIIASSGSGAAVFSDSEVHPWCCDFYGNEGGDWVGCVADAFIPEMGNISLDPLFCESGVNEFNLQDKSPCGTGGTCGVMGAMPVGCQ